MHVCVADSVASLCVACSVHEAQTSTVAVLFACGD